MQVGRTKVRYGQDRAKQECVKFVIQSQKVMSQANRVLGIRQAQVEGQAEVKASGIQSTGEGVGRRRRMVGTATDITLHYMSFS